MHGIRFDPPCIVFPNTYISSTSRIVAKVLNESDEMHHISFRNKETVQEEIELLNQHDILNPEQRNAINTLFEYSNDFFTIDRLELDIWPHSYQQITFTFSPHIAIRNTSFAYVQIDEYKERYKMQIVATGLPPNAQFLTTQIIVGDVFLDSILEYQVILQNKGDVPVHFCYEPHDTGNLGFEFAPSEGEIAVNNQVPIIIRFIASAVKIFNETFVFKIEGSVGNNPSIVISGQVIGPSFTINPKQLDFGNVGYGFLYSKTLLIENKSEIPFDFKLRMSHDGSFERREFQLKPEFGTMGKFSKQEITVEFIPISIQSYSLSLLLDITRYGTNLAEIPITACCFCPKLELVPSSFNFNDSFIGYKYSHEVIIRNNFPYPAKFEFVPQDSESRKKGIIESDKETGLVGPNSDAMINLFFTTQTIGLLSVDCFFRVFGSDDPPMKFTFKTKSIGPQISLSSDNISFGTIPVLVSKATELDITNNSLIEANFKCHIESSTGGFEVLPREEKIPPQSNLPISITAFVNDIISFSGNLKLYFDYLNPISIPLKAQGTGSPIVSSINMKNIDFGFVLTEQTAVKKFVMENKANRPYDIRFTPNKVQTPKNQKSDFIFSINPEHVVIPGNSSQTFIINLNCTMVVPFKMPLQCHGSIGRQRILLYDSILKGSFVKPLVTFSETTLEFELKCLPIGEPRSQMAPSKEQLKPVMKSLTITNESKLSLPIEVNCPAPFKIDVNNFNIEPEETKELIITFDPSLKKNFVTETVQRTIIFSLVDHPQKISVIAKGTIIFPNVKFSGDSLETTESEDPNFRQKIDFGVLMMNTEQTKSIEMTNNVNLQVEYEWQLISTDFGANKIFDIFPLYGKIEPNESIQSHFSFFALADPNGDVHDYSATAICHVTGGPDYAVSLAGSSATILYKVDPVSFSYSSICYSSTVTDTMTITNSSKASISFAVKIPRNNGFQSFSVSPKTGIISPNDSASLSLSIVPGLPMLFKESFFIQIGDFEDVKIDIVLEARFSQVLISLPRNQNDASTVSLKEKVDNKGPNKASQMSIPNTLNDSILKSNVSILLGQKKLQQYQQQQKDLYNFTDEQLLEEEKLVILDQMNTEMNEVSDSKASTPSNARDVNYVASYEIQFGEMIVSESVKKKFNVKSVAPFPITFEMDLTKLKKTGMKIEPSTVKDLMPDDEVEIDVTFVPINRKLNETGKICYKVPFIFNDNHRLLLNISATMTRPFLNFSSTAFEFDRVIIGQTKVMTIQLQNISSGSCEFRIGSFEDPNEVASKLNSSSRRMMNKERSNEDKKQNQIANQSPFTTTPDSGVLPPSSFMNVAINFSPYNDKPTKMRFPINVSYNNEPFYVSVSGTGEFLKLVFEPRELSLPSIQPYSNSSTANVIVKNPNPYPIEFFSLQFDQQLITEESIDPRQTESPFVTYTPKAKQNPAAVSKFAICIIINGPPYSGKTTIANELASFFKLPVLNLKDVWSDTTDYLSKLYTVLISSEYSQGFIIDGLDGFDDNGENETFLQSVFKMNKNASDDVVKNPFTCFNHQGQSTFEHALDIVLGALNGHFVFHIAIKLPIEDTKSRKSLKAQAEELTKLKALEEEKEKLFSMSEEEYLKLDEVERLDIDNKRKYFRNEIIASIEKMMAEKRSQEEGHDKKKRIDDSRSSGRNDKQQAKKKTKLGQVPNDPIQAMSLAFLYSLGIISQKVQNSSERYKAIDPFEIRPKVEEVNNEEEEEVNKTLSYEHLMNNLLLDGTKSVDDLIRDLLEYLPPMRTLKDVAFRMQIPEPQIKDDSTNDSLKIVNKISQFFSIVKEEVLNQTKQAANKKGSTKTDNNDSNTQSLDNIDENILKNLTNRWKLPPNGETNLTIRFESTTTGNISESLLFSIAKCQMQPAKLIVKGLCQFPEIERNFKLIFDKLIKNFESKSCPAFVVSQSEFNFGYCITCKDKPQKGQMQNKTVLKLTNVSEFNADCQASFVQQTGNTKSVWLIEQPNFSIKPSSSVDLTVGFHPTSSEHFKAKLGIFIKDNPEPLFIDFSGESSVPVVETQQSSIDFEKILIGSAKTKKIELKNTGKLPAYWKLKGSQQFSPNMSFSITEGELMPSKTCGIFVKFTSQKPVQVKKPVTVEVYDIDKSRVFSSFNVNLSAESFDVSFDVMFPKGQQDQFDFGQLKIGQSRVVSVNLRNRGKYPVDYKFMLTNKDVSKYVKISSKEGSVKNGDKLVQVNFTFCSNSVVKFDSTKFISLTVIDSQTKSITAQLSYSLTASTFYSMFAINCEKSINGDKSIDFGSVPSNTSFHKEIVLTNKGPFPFEYDFHAKQTSKEDDGKNSDIINNAADDVSESGSVTSSSGHVASKKKGAAAQQSGASKQKQKKNQQNATQISAYLVYPASGALNAGASVTVSVDLNSAEAGKFNAAMVLSVSEANPNEKETLFILSSEVFVPGINVADKERLFPRLPLCIRFDLAKSDLTSFLEDENVLHFAPLIAGKKETVNVRLLNQQPIPIDVDLSVKSKGKSNPFDISEKSVHINGNDFSNIVVTFAPSSSDNYQAAFEANVRNGTNPATKTLKFGIEGAGTIPSISLKTQIDKGKGSSYVVNMGKTLVGFDKCRGIAIGNDSQAPCTVLLQIGTKQVVDFTIEGCDVEKPFVVDPGHQFSFNVRHRPQKVRKSQVDVCASCIENQKSSISFSFVAEGYSEDVVFEGLEGEDNELHFRGAVVGRPQTVSFAMRNFSDTTIRFQWASSSEFSFSPRVGHIQPLQSKEMTVTFSSEKPTKCAGTKGICQVSKIELVDPDAEDWDDTQKMLTFVPRSEVLADQTTTTTTSRNQQQQQQANNNKSSSKSSSKSSKNSKSNANLLQTAASINAALINTSVEPIDDMISVAAVKPEPTYNVVSSGKPKELCIKIFAVSDVIKLNVDTNEIPFSPTMMFQTRTSEFKMTNSSQIRIEYEWVLNGFESLRTDYSATRPCPFTVEPSSGFIEAGQQKVFRATFAPMEVDDFVATFKCVVPYYNQEPQTLTLTALSRRPLCHFNVPLSDYLTRKHYEFTEELPQDVKVIEIFTKSVKSKTSTKIEIINPTLQPYETKWSLLKDNSNGAITCDNMSAIVSSGKQYFFPFTYSPKNAKTVECLFLFEIPIHNIKVPFLIVGRITH